MVSFSFSFCFYFYSSSLVYRVDIFIITLHNIFLIEKIVWWWTSVSDLFVSVGSWLCNKFTWKEIYKVRYSVQLSFLNLVLFLAFHEPLFFLDEMQTFCTVMVGRDGFNRDLYAKFSLWGNFTTTIKMLQTRF